MPRSLVMVLAAFPMLAHSANLDKIDARGVTETGGSSQFAHMIPRTGESGRLDVSLLPSMGSWLMPLLPLTYYVSSTAPQGIGTVQSPLSRISQATAIAADGSVVVCLPGTYTDVISLRAGQPLTIKGQGLATHVSNLRVTVTGSGSPADLRIDDCAVDSLEVYGGDLSLRLKDTQVVSLIGSSRVTLFAHDIESDVANHSTPDYSRVYVGYRIAPEAGMLNNGSNTLAVVDGRVFISGPPHPGRLELATRSEVYSAHNTALNAVDALAACVTGLATRVDAEGQSRAGADTALSNRIESVASAVYSSTGAAAGLQGDMATLSARLSVLYSMVSNSLGSAQGEDDPPEGGDPAEWDWLPADLANTMASFTTDLNELQQALTRKADISYLSDYIRISDGAFLTYVDSDPVRGAVSIGNHQVGAGGVSTFVQGRNLAAYGDGSHVLGRNAGDNGANWSFVWNPQETQYVSSGPGRFSINPVGGVDGVYIGGRSLADILAARSDAPAISNLQSAVTKLVPRQDFVATNNAINATIAGVRQESMALGVRVGAVESSLETLANSLGGGGEEEDIGSALASVGQLVSSVGDMTNSINTALAHKSNIFDIGTGLARHDSEWVCWYSDVLKTNGAPSGFVYTKYDPRTSADSAGAGVYTIPHESGKYKTVGLVYVSGLQHYSLYAPNGKWITPFTGTPTSYAGSVVQLSPALLNAVSNHTAQIFGLGDQLLTKQDRLSPGPNVRIADGVISVVGGNAALAGQHLPLKNVNQIVHALAQVIYALGGDTNDVQNIVR